MFWCAKILHECKNNLKFWNNSKNRIFTLYSIVKCTFYYMSNLCWFNFNYLQVLITYQKKPKVSEV